MQRHVFHLTGDKQFAPGKSHPSGTAGAAVMFVHGERETELEECLVQQSIPAGAIKACVEPHQATRIAVYGECLLITIPVNRSWDDGRLHCVNFICNKRELIVFSQQKCDVLNDMVRQYSEGLRFHAATLSAVLYQSLDFIVDENMMFTMQSRKELLRIEELAEANDEAFAGDSAQLKRHLSNLSATVEDQLYCLRSLQTIETSAVSIDEMREYLSDTIADLEHASRNVERQETRLAAAHQEVQIRQQNRTNDQLQFLTILSTIFLPLTLITGIYGMNFRNMPEYGWRYGYAGVLIAMVLLASAMLWGFYRAKWIK